MAAQPRPIGFWLKLLDRLIDEHFAEVLEEHGVTRRQWQILNVLSSGESTVEHLDEAVAPFLAGEEGESSLEHLTELIESGWVAATETGYEMTERGFTAVERLSEVVTELRSSAGEGVSAEEYDQTLAVLEENGTQPRLGRQRRLI